MVTAAAAATSEKLPLKATDADADTDEDTQVVVRRLEEQSTLSGEQTQKPLARAAQPRNTGLQRWKSLESDLDEKEQNLEEHGYFLPEEYTESELGTAQLPTATLTLCDYPSGN
ncbi:hypothetical protein Daesc_001571 [Daldinia eschscholtzii]|uniref:Uncharacterized protein n=1 Tax=Daldinia eschscholtzii TaxID=292717 RepID=A0AAX6MUV0_9PEZI